MGAMDNLDEYSQARGCSPPAATDMCKAHRHQVGGRPGVGRFSARGCYRAASGARGGGRQWRVRQGLQASSAQCGGMPIMPMARWARGTAVRTRAAVSAGAPQRGCATAAADALQPPGAALQPPVSAGAPQGGCAAAAADARAVMVQAAGSTCQAVASSSSRGRGSSSWPGTPQAGAVAAAAAPGPASAVLRAALQPQHPAPHHPQRR
jgi:hypothetical protein